MARSAIAGIERDGLTPGFAEIIAPSMTNIFSYPNTRLFLSITPLEAFEMIKKYCEKLDNHYVKKKPTRLLNTTDDVKFFWYALFVS